MKAIRVNVKNFNEKVKQAVETGNPVFVLFFGTELPETSKSWCGDCVIADPIIRKAVLTVENSILIEAPVGDRNEWKGNSTHPYRVQFNVPAIPTLFKWSIDGPGEKLVEEECAVESNLAKFVSQK